MPDPGAVRTDNPEVVRLLLAHEVAKAAAPPAGGAYDKWERADVEQYLEVFATVYRALKDTTTAAGPAPEEDVQKGGQGG